MAGGDTLIVGDGTYAEQIAKPPSGTANAYTTVKAARDWGVTIDGCGFADNYQDGVRVNGSYVVVRGFHVKMNQAKTTNLGVDLYGCNHVKVQRCSVAYAGTSDNVAAFGVGPGSDYVLLEENYVYGGARYPFLVYQSTHTVVRRNVSRLDYWNGSLQAANFTNYNGDMTVWQNNIAIDSDTQGHCWLRAFRRVLQREQGPGFVVVRHRHARDLPRQHRPQRPGILLGHLRLRRLQPAHLLGRHHLGLARRLLRRLHPRRRADARRDPVHDRQDSRDVQRSQWPGLRRIGLLHRARHGWNEGRGHGDQFDIREQPLLRARRLRDGRLQRLVEQRSRPTTAESTRRHRPALTTSRPIFPATSSTSRASRRARRFRPRDRAEVQSAPTSPTGGARPARCGARPGYDSITSELLWPFPNEDVIKADMASLQRPRCDGCPRLHHRQQPRRHAADPDQVRLGIPRQSDPGGRVRLSHLDWLVAVGYGRNSLRRPGDGRRWNPAVHVFGDGRFAARPLARCNDRGDLRDAYRRRLHGFHDHGDGLGLAPANHQQGLEHRHRPGRQQSRRGGESRRANYRWLRLRDGRIRNDLRQSRGRDVRGGLRLDAPSTPTPVRLQARVADGAVRGGGGRTRS